MWDRYMSDPSWEEQKRQAEQKMKQEVELEEKIFRISHPILAKIDDARIKIGRKILGL